MNNPLASLPGEHNYVKLACGNCHYRVDGPENAPVVLLIHGATVSGWFFDRLRLHLTNAGLRTLTVDLWGHGYSERPNATYDIALFRDQIIELIDTTLVRAIDRRPPIHIIGHSMGAAIAASLITAYPERFARVVLGAPLINFVANKPIVKIFKLPILGEFLNRFYLIPKLKSRRRQRYAPIEDGRFIDKFMSQFLLPGFEKTLLTLFRSDALVDQSDKYYQLSQLGHPCLVFHGCEDELVTAEQIAYLAKLIPNAQIEKLEKLDHAFILSHPERIAKKLIAFLKE